MPNDQPELVHPSLYARAGDGTLFLQGVRCSACGRRAFPFQPYGCEKCGAHGEALEALSLEARGHLVSYAKVHRHQGKDIDAPFIIAQIQLDAGVFVRATLASPDDSSLKAGQRMTGGLVAAQGSNEGKLELRFSKEEL